MTLVSWVIAAMTLLAPGRDHVGLARAIASALEDTRPLFRGDDDRRRTAAIVVAVAYRESSFRNEARSKTNDFCAMQINRRPDLADDPEECVRVGLAMLRESMLMCPSHPIAFYASGPAGCANARAQRISRDRMAIAASLVAQVAP